MTAPRENVSSRVAPDLLLAMREIARRERRSFQEVLEEAVRNYVESKPDEKVRPQFIAHFRASVERNRRLYELLADS